MHPQVTRRGLLRYHQFGLDGAKVGRDWAYVAIRQYHCARLVGQPTLWRNQSGIYVANAGFGEAV